MPPDVLETLNMEVRMSLLEERLHEGFRSVDARFDGVSEKLDVVINGNTVNCQAHRSRLDQIEKDIKTKANKYSVAALWAIVTPLGIALIVSMFKHFLKV